MTVGHTFDFATCLKHAFLSGVVAARNIPGHEPCDGSRLWVDYELFEPGCYVRVRGTLLNAPTIGEKGAVRDQTDIPAG